MAAALKLNLDDQLRMRLEARASANGFSSVKAYVEALLVADAAGDPLIDDAQLESLLLNRLAGPFVDVDSDDFQQMRKKLQDRLGNGRASERGH